MEEERSAVESGLMKKNEKKYVEARRDIQRCCRERAGRRKDGSMRKMARFAQIGLTNEKGRGEAEGMNNV